MKSTTAVNFETFYFFELLEMIQTNALQQYNEEEQSYLVRLIAYLSSDSDAQANIEKLAASQNTSDLSIFFSDILDRLRSTQPDAAIKKLSDYAQDFLEIFEVFLQNDDWKEAVNRQLYDHIPIEEEVVEDALSLDQYCQHVIQQKIGIKASELPEELRGYFHDHLYTLILDPDIADQLAEKLADPRVTEFTDISRVIASGPPSENIDNFMNNFEANVEKWINLFLGIFAEHSSEVNAIFQPVPAEPAREAPVETPFETEQPFEKLFEAAEEKIQFSEEFEELEHSDEELDLISNDWDIKKIKKTALSDEEKERRQFLREYVINEVKSYADEALVTVNQLCDTPGDSNLASRLNENLK
ncbi:MAG: hypothetical protein ACE5GL_12110, partial [Calditrichia bacterium]